jgi:hypothetical protein
VNKSVWMVCDNILCITLCFGTMHSVCGCVCLCVSGCLVRSFFFHILYTRIHSAGYDVCDWCMFVRMSVCV